MGGFGRSVLDPSSKVVLPVPLLAASKDLAPLFSLCEWTGKYKDILAKKASADDEFEEKLAGFYAKESDAQFAALEQAEEELDEALFASLWEHPSILLLEVILGPDPLSAQPDAMTELMDALWTSDTWGRTCTDEATGDMRA